MAGSLRTSNYNLSKYAANDTTSWLVDFNGNMDKIDAQMKANSDVNAGTVGDVEGINQKVTALEERTGALETAVETLEETTTISDIVTTKSSNVVSLVSNAYKTGDLIQGSMYGAITKNGGELSTIDYSDPGQKLIPLALLSGNPFNLDLVSNPTSTDLTFVGNSVLRADDNSNLRVLNGLVWAYYNGTSTILAITAENGILVSTYNFVDITMNICQKILD